MEQYREAVVDGFANDVLVSLAERLVACAKSGLRKRGKQEEMFLAPLVERVKTRSNPANEVLQLWDRGGLEAVYTNRDFVDSIKESALP